MTHTIKFQMKLRSATENRTYFSLEIQTYLYIRLHRQNMIQLTLTLSHGEEL